MVSLFPKRATLLRPEQPRDSKKVTKMAKYLGKQTLAKVAPNHPFAKPQIGFVPRPSAASKASSKPQPAVPQPSGPQPSKRK
jgi:hypothetical protein